MPQAENFMDELQEICKNGPSTLSQAQIDFLRARRSYLTPEQEKQFIDVLEVEQKKEEVTMVEIKERAMALGLVIPNRTKKADALKMVEDAEAKNALTADDTGKEDSDPPSPDA